MLYTERIKALRSDHDLNQTQVARAIHVAQTTYSDYEKGKVRIPVECLIQLAKFYDVDMNYITGVSGRTSGSCVGEGPEGVADFPKAAMFVFVLLVDSHLVIISPA